MHKRVLQKQTMVYGAAKSSINRFYKMLFLSALFFLLGSLAMISKKVNIANEIYVYLIMASIGFSIVFSGSAFGIYLNRSNIM